MPTGTECYKGAALRHFDDAHYLATDSRWDDAGDLMGFAAECSVKHAVQQHTRSAVPHVHFPDLTRRITGRSADATCCTPCAKH